MAKLVLAPGITKESTPLSVGAGYVDSSLIRFRNGQAAPVFGWILYTANQLSGTCRAIHEYSNNSGTAIKAFGTNAGLYALIADTLYNITPDGFAPGSADAYFATGFGVGGYGLLGFGLSGSPSTDPLLQILNQPLIWSLDNFGQDLIACPYADIRNPGPIYVWHGATGGGQQATLLMDDPSAINVPILACGCFVSAQSEQLIAVSTNPFDGTAIDPMLIRWSDIESETDWFPTQANSAGDYRLPIGSFIVGWLNTYYETLFWTDKAIYSMQFSNTNAVFSFNPISVKGISMISPRAAISNGSQVYWMDNGAFFFYNGSVNELPCTLKKFVYDNINRMQKFKIYAAHNHSYSEVWWFYPSINSSEIDSYVMYNYQSGVWANGLLARTAWSDATEYPLATNSTGNIYQHETGVDAAGEPLPYSLTSGDIDIDNGQQYVLLNRLICDYNWTGSAGPAQQLSIDIRVKQSSDQPARVAKTVQVVPVDNNKGYTDARVRGRRVSFRTYNPGVTGSFWTAGTTQADFQPDGEV